MERTAQDGATGRKVAGIDRAKLYAAIEAGELPAYTPNGSTRRVIFEDDLVAWVKGK